MPTIPIIQIEEKPPTPAEMDHLVQEFSMMIRLNKKKEVSKVVVGAVGATVVIVLSAAVAFLGYYLTSEPSASREEVQSRTEKVDVTEFQHMVKDQPVAPVEKVRAGPSVVTHDQDLGAEQLKELEAKKKAAAEAAVEEEGLVLEVIVPEKPGVKPKPDVVPAPTGATGRPAPDPVPPAPTGAQVEPIKVTPVPDAAGKVEAPVVLPTLGGPTDKPAVTDAQIGQLLARSRTQFGACKQTAGELPIKISFQVTPNGVVTGQHVTLPAGQPDLGMSACLRKVIGLWSFPKGEKELSFSKTILL